jgi:hypothetical protein
LWEQRLRSFKVFSFIKIISWQIVLQYRQWCSDMDEGKMPEGIERLVEEVRRERDLQIQMNQLNAASNTPRPPTRSDEADMIESPS